MSQPVTLAVIASPGHSGQTWLSLLIGAHPHGLSLGEVDALYGLQHVDRSCMLCGEGCEFWSAFNKVWSPEKNIFLQLADFSGARLLSISKVEKFRGQLGDDRLRVKLIRLLRDGRAVTASYLRKYPAWRYDDIVKQWVLSSRENDSWLLKIPPENRIIVRYEELVEQTAATLRTICTFIGIDYQENMISYWKVKHHIVDGNRGTLSFVQRHLGLKSNPGDKTFYDSQEPASFRDERWRQELTPYQLYRFQRIGGDLNERYGYASPEAAGSLAALARSYVLHTRERIKKLVA